MERLGSRTLLVIFISFALIAFVFYRVGYRRAAVAVTPAARVQAVRQAPATTVTRAPVPLANVMMASAGRAAVAPNQSAVSDPPVPASAASASPAAGACAPGWEALARATLDEARVSLVTDRRLVLPMDCLLQMKAAPLPEAIRSFVDECQLGLAGQDPSTLDANCGARLAEFRAWIVRQARAGVLELGGLEPADLANQLYGGFVDPRNLLPEDLDRNVAIAEELIARDPNLYAGYKGKLLSLLQKELKYGLPVESAEYETLYEQMTQFRGFAGQGTEEGLSSAELGQIDGDLIHIPFLRAAALGDAAGLTTMAQDYISAYPQSYVGYYYLAKSQWSQGDQAAAIGTFKAMLGPTAPDALALEMLKRTQGKTALERLQEMKIE